MPPRTRRAPCRGVDAGGARRGGRVVRCLRASAHRARVSELRCRLPRVRGLVQSWLCAALSPLLRDGVEGAVTEDRARRIRPPGGGHWRHLHGCRAGPRRRAHHHQGAHPRRRHRLTACCWGSNECLTLAGAAAGRRGGGAARYDPGHQCPHRTARRQDGTRDHGRPSRRAGDGLREPLRAVRQSTSADQSRWCRAGCG